MRYQKVYINGIGYHLPEETIQTRALEDELAPIYRALKIPHGQLEALTGIRERRWWPRHFQVSDGAIVAGDKALRALGLSGSDIDTLIYTGVCRDHYEPATACRIAASLGVSGEATLYDLSNACLGVLNGIIEVANRIELGQAQIGLVVSCESSREVNEDALALLKNRHDIQTFRDNIATFTGGSGAVAVVISRFPDLGQAHRLLGGAIRNDSSQHELCRWGLKRVRETVFEQFMITDAINVMKHGVSLGIKTWQALLQELGWRGQQVDKIISHQVGSTHRRSVLHALDIHESKDFATFPYLGNMGTVSLPLTAALAAENGFLQPRDQVAWLGIGSGLNCLMLGVEW